MYDACIGQKSSPLLHWFNRTRLFLLDSEINSVGEGVCNPGVIMEEEIQRSECGEPELIMLSAQQCQPQREGITLQTAHSQDLPLYST